MLRACLTRPLAVSTPFVASTSVALPLACMPVRALSIHEHSSQTLMKSYGVSCPKSGVAYSAQEARDVAIKLAEEGVDDFVVKAQVLAGGRGKGHFTNGFQGGVHMCYSPDEVADMAGKMIGQSLVTKQTGADGRPCGAVMVTERAYTRREFYFAILNDRAHNGPVFVCSPEGGMDIEGVAAANPDAITTIPVPLDGPTPEILEQVVNILGFSDKASDEAKDNISKLFKLFMEKDATLLEINPFAETPDNKVSCMDAKLNFDENAAFRQKDIFALRDTSQENPAEVEAAKFDLNFIALDGDIGCLVNGAGLAMGTMDIISLHGGSPANFLDVGGGATEEQVKEAFKIITSDDKVRAILVNIFGGIMRCDVIAMGIINACQSLDISIPIVVRLQGTRVEEARLLLEASPVKVIPIDDLDMAASRAVKFADIVTLAREASIDVQFQIPI